MKWASAVPSFQRTLVWRASEARQVSQSLALLALEIGRSGLCRTGIAGQAEAVPAARMLICTVTPLKPNACCDIEYVCRPIEQ